jgi:cytochrome c oxidase cbb3-type subunit 4
MEWLAANYVLLKELWVVWFVALFVGIVAWAFWPSNKARLEAQARIPFEDERDATARSVDPRR